MGYETKTLPELEEIARNLRAQIRLNPQYHLERAEVNDVERLLAQLRAQAPPMRGASGGQSG